MDASLFSFIEINYNIFISQAEIKISRNKRTDKNEAFDIVNDVIIDFNDKERYKKLEWDPSAMFLYIIKSIDNNCRSNKAPHFRKMGLIKEFIPWMEKGGEEINEDEIFGENKMNLIFFDYDSLVNDRDRWKRIFGEDHIFYRKIWKMFREGLSTREIGKIMGFSHVRIFYDLKYITEKIKSNLI